VRVPDQEWPGNERFANLKPAKERAVDGPEGLDKISSLEQTLDAALVLLVATRAEASRACCIQQSHSVAL
jgi:hypothetical protein